MAWQHVIFYTIPLKLCLTPHPKHLILSHVVLSQWQCKLQDASPNLSCCFSTDVDQSSASARGKKSLDFSTPRTRHQKYDTAQSNNHTLTPFDSPGIDTQASVLDDSFPKPLETSLSTESELYDAFAKNHGIVADDIGKSRKRMQDDLFGELSDDDNDLLPNINPAIGKLCIL